MTKLPNPNPGPFAPRVPRAHAVAQPFPYPLRREWVEPDWRRLPGYRDVSTQQWESAQWQRAHTVKNLKEFKEALGESLLDGLAEDIQRDMFERATMSMLIPPQMINTMDETRLDADPSAGTWLQPSPNGTPNGPAILTPPATACTRRTCGPSKG